MFGERDYYKNGMPGYLNAILRPETMTMRLIIINCIVFLLTNGLKLTAMKEFFCLGTGSFFYSHPWGLLTYMFLHADFTHILFNMYALWLFGRMTESRLGEKRMLILYLSSGLIGGALWLLCNWHTNVVLIGASGSVFGIMTAAAMAFPHAQFLLLLPPVRCRLWALVLVYVLFELLFLGANSNVAHLAHLGGALGGLIFMNRLGFNIYLPDNLKFWKRFSKKSRRYTGENENFHFDQTELNRILDKLANHGDGALTQDERDYLRKAAEELKKR